MNKFLDYLKGLETNPIFYFSTNFDYQTYFQDIAQLDKLTKCFRIKTDSTDIITMCVFSKKIPYEKLELISEYL